MSKEPDILPEDRDQWERDEYDRSFESAFNRAIRITIALALLAISGIIALIINA